MNKTEITTMKLSTRFTIQGRGLGGRTMLNPAARINSRVKKILMTAEDAS